MKIGVAVMATWLVILTCAAAQPGCPSTFFSTLLQLMPCRAAVAPFNPAPPSDACCNAVRVLGQPCLCVLVNGPAISGVDRYVAMQLPSKCNVAFQPCDSRV